MPSRIAFGRYLRPSLLLMGSLLLPSCQTGGVEPSSEPSLHRAWEEYGYQSFAAADRLFEAAGSQPGASKELKLQSLLGRAFIVQHQMPRRDPARALAMYSSLLEQIGTDHPFGALILARQADCIIDLDPSRIQEARDGYEEAIRASPAGSLVGQETILRLTTTYMMQADTAGFREGLEVVDQYSPMIEGRELAGVLHGLASELAFFLGDLRRMALELERQNQSGIRNIQVREKVLFQLARLHDVEFNDPERARHFYLALADGVPSSVKAHYARLRAAELLHAGRLEPDRP
jgi:hypothetical protein